MADFPFRDPELSVDERVRDLIGRLTVQEKCGQLLHEAPAIERLGIPSYNWWNECLHGVARAGIATIFPQAIGLAATFDQGLVGRIAEIIADEARAKHHDALAHGDTGYYKGLTFWTPNINIFRDPRWGRGHETYGECPYLTGRMGVAFCRGLQGDDDRHLKLVATPKHYAVHSGPEGLRHRFDARPSPQDLRATYLPAFRDCIVEAGARSIMGAYNRVDGEPCNGSPTLLQQILRDEWGFDGYVVSDCWAIRDFHAHHHVTETPAQSAALAIEAGCDLNCGCTYEALGEALEEGLLAEADLDRSLERLLRARIELGMFDPEDRVVHARVPFERIDCDEHRALAREAAGASIVLLRNRDGLLPLRRDLGAIAVIGPNAYDHEVLKANYSGHNGRIVTPLEGIRAAVSEGTAVHHCFGSKLTHGDFDFLHGFPDLSEAASYAERSDVAVVCLGLSADIEGEEGDTSNPEAAGDKTSLDLPGKQQELLEAVVATGTPTVLVLISGSALSVTWADEHVPAILQAWYGGEEAGNALADVLFGARSPSGRLPVTFPRSLADVPDFTDYAMEGRTYRYLAKEPLYPFGYGLGYARFDYSGIELAAEEFATGDEVVASVEITNAGELAADEIVQCYLRCVDAPFPVPHHELRGVRRVHLAPGETREVPFVLDARALSQIDAAGRRMVLPGAYRLFVGGGQPDARTAELTGREPSVADFRLAGETLELAY